MIEGADIKIWSAIIDAAAKGIFFAVLAYFVSRGTPTALDSLVQVLASDLSFSPSMKSAVAESAGHTGSNLSLGTTLLTLAISLQFLLRVPELIMRLARARPYIVLYKNANDKLIETPASETTEVEDLRARLAILKERIEDVAGVQLVQKKGKGST